MYFCSACVILSNREKYLIHFLYEILQKKKKNYNLSQSSKNHILQGEK